ncbi:MAG: hypothetical protein K2P38_01630 [Lachnospiraceae bacterium]|nr:hypothetical protein [Lachnospiraceae bacterium]
MAIAGVENNLYAYTYYKNSAAKSSSAGFSTAVSKASSQKESVVDEFRKKHPDQVSIVNRQVNAGKEVLRKNGAENISREDMTMEEYKQFFTGLMNSIPCDSSQKNDVQIWNITDKGWEQMKNDPEYEAWVLGYTSMDRSVHIPFASMPGYAPNLHTEHFGASIEEHLGQSVPMGGSSQTPSSDSDEENWWEKRHKNLEEFLEDQAKKAQQRRTFSQRRNQQAQLLQAQMQMMANAGFGHSFSNYDFLSGGYPASLAGAILSGGGKGWRV